MAIAQSITVGVGGVINIHPQARPANASVSIYSGTGACLVSDAPASISPVATSLSASVTAGSRSLGLANVAGIAARDVLIVADPIERVRVKSVGAGSVVLWQPTRDAHSNGASVTCPMVSYYVPAAVAAEPWWDGRAKWVIDGSVVYTTLECVEYPLDRTTTEQDVYDVSPQMGQMLAAEEDPDGALDAAHDWVLEQIGKRGRARVYPASREWHRAVACAFCRNHYLAQSSDVGREMFERFDREARDAIASVMASIGADADGDGVVTPYEQRRASSIRLERG